MRPQNMLMGNIPAQCYRFAVGYVPVAARHTGLVSEDMIKYLGNLSQTCAHQNRQVVYNLPWQSDQLGLAQVSLSRTLYLTMVSSTTANLGDLFHKLNWPSLACVPTSIPYDTRGEDQAQMNHCMFKQ